MSIGLTGLVSFLNWGYPTHSHFHMAFLVKMNTRNFSIRYEGGKVVGTSILKKFHANVLFFRVLF